jgi:hypothetical protein
MRFQATVLALRARPAPEARRYISDMKRVLMLKVSVVSPSAFATPNEQPGNRGQEPARPRYNYAFQATCLASLGIPSPAARARRA